MKRNRGSGESEGDSKQVRFADPADEDLAHMSGEDEEHVARKRSQGTGKVRKSEEEEDAERSAVEAPLNDWRQVEEETYGERQLEELEKEEFEPFNLNEERQLGQFDEQGSFTWKRRDLDDEGDTEWLEQVEDEVAKRPRRETDGDDASDEEEEAPIDVSRLFWKVIKHLKDNEDSAAALKRLKEQTGAFHELTDACALLLRHGMMNIYSLKRGDLTQKLRPLQWEYRVVGTSEVHGPYSGVDMQAWRDDGFFLKESAEMCEARQVGQDSWFPADRIETFLLPAL